MKHAWKSAARATCLASAVLVMLHTVANAAEPDPEAGARVFGVCAACHSLEPGRHMTGPSLAGILGREAGTAPGFDRYSEALRESELVWDTHSLDAFLADPQTVIPGNRMSFRGIDNAGARADLVAFLEQVSDEDRARQGAEPRAGSGGMMGAPELADLKALGPDQRVAAIRYCGDTYRVTTETGRTFPFWEFNLRFKTDSSDKGPHPGEPVIIGAGMRGDRAFVVFADPAEISASIEQECE